MLVFLAISRKNSIFLSRMRENRTFGQNTYQIIYQISPWSMTKKYNYKLCFRWCISKLRTLRLRVSYIYKNCEACIRVTKVTFKIITKKISVSQHLTIATLFQKNEKRFYREYKYARELHHLTIRILLKINFLVFFVFNRIPRTEINYFLCWFIEITTKVK